MLIDLHCHTLPLSTCSSLSPEALVRAAKAAGLDGVCLTEHDRLPDQAAMRALAEAFGIVVLRGMEVTTELGHVLVFGLDAPPPGMFLAESLRAAVDRAGGLMALAHPARAGMPRVDRATVARLFDMVEVLNGSDGPEQNRAAEAFTPLMRLPGIGGSDCHAPAEVARAATRLPYAVADEAGLIAALRAGQHRALLVSQAAD